VGTHIDALCHFSCNGQLHGGIEAAGVQSYGGGIERHTIDQVEPVLRHGVLLDIAKAEGVDVLARDFLIRAEHLDKIGVKVGEGDVALIRTGWAKYWNDAAKFISEVRSPGWGWILRSGLANGRSSRQDPTRRHSSLLLARQ
jgi:kynurenine formamidase